VQPLLAGAIPVYLGAPNIAEFAPGPRALVDARAFPSPEALAAHLLALRADPAALSDMLAWRATGPSPAFRRLMNASMTRGRPAPSRPPARVSPPELRARPAPLTCAGGLMAQQRVRRGPAPRLPAQRAPRSATPRRRARGEDSTRLCPPVPESLVAQLDLGVLHDAFERALPHGVARAGRGEL
jgi:hypothetical protein